MPSNIPKFLFLMFCSPEGGYKCPLTNWYTCSLALKYQMAALSGSLTTASSTWYPAFGTLALFHRGETMQEKEFPQDARVGTWELSLCSWPGLHLAPHNLTATFSPFLSPSHGVRNQPREQIQHFPSLLCSGPAPGEREQRSRSRRGKERLWGSQPPGILL